jgi:hypothetical protein
MISSPAAQRPGLDLWRAMESLLNGNGSTHAERALGTLLGSPARDGSGNWFMAVREHRGFLYRITQYRHGGPTAHDFDLRVRNDVLEMIDLAQYTRSLMYRSYALSELSLACRAS